MSTTNINNHIENINKSLRWIKTHQPEHYEKRFLQLVEERRKLKKIKNALSEKPAIAAFGESQKGKSYLIGNLLQKQKNPFMVKNEKGDCIDFVDRVNPIGDKKEATGVVTRFTPFNHTEANKRYRTEHPVIIKTLSVSNIATILCDSYFLDIDVKELYTDAELKERVDGFYNKYINYPEITQNIFVEDDVLEMKAYLQKYVNIAQGLVKSGYFEKLALVISRIPQNEWINVLKYLWHEEQPITNLFGRLLNAKRKIEFAKEVYVDFDAVMHLGDNKNTIMSVDCLNGLDDINWDRTTNVYLLKNNNFVVVNNFSKSELSAICAESIFKIEEEYLCTEENYAFNKNSTNLRVEELSKNTYSKLSEKVTKDLLKDSDLLDFPGARNRLKLEANKLTLFDSEAGASNLVQMLLRGKVAFLFNHYNESRIINILMFCHDNEQPSVNEMYRMINSWVEEYVGKTPQERNKTVIRCGGVSPLFVIGTKFNCDMIEKGDEDGDSESALNQRWEGRFMKVLYTQSFQAGNVEWFKNWDRPSNSFKNTYLLRDFKYSGCDGKGNNLYEGYNSKEIAPKENNLKLTESFYKKLRDTFTNHEIVKMFFADPETSWDVAATINNDGALYIIEKLGVVAKRVSENRQSQFNEIVKHVCNNVLAVMKEYFVTDDTTEILAENIRKAHGLFRELEFANQSQPDFFGRLIESLQFSESEAYNQIHLFIPQLANIINSQEVIKDYELIRRRCNQFEGCNNENEKWQRLIQYYHFANREEANEYLNNRGIDCSKLFQGEAIKRRPSSVIADQMIKLWKDKITDMQFLNLTADQVNVDKIALDYLVTCILNSAQNTHLNQVIEERISKFVDGLDTGIINEDLVADMIATFISDFITNFGYTLLSSEEIASARRVVQTNHLPAFDWIERERKETYEDDELTTLFNDILSSTDQFTPAYDMNYNCWLEYMYIASVAHINVPDYDREANEKLKVLINEFQC